MNRHEGRDPGPYADHSTPTIWLWQGCAAYPGPSLHLDMHATAVHCFALGVDAPFALTVAGTESRVRSVVIPARTPHRIRAGTGRMLFFYLDPGTTVPCPDEAILLGHLMGGSDPHTLRHMVLGDTPAEPADPRIAWAMRRIATDPVGSPGATGLAAAVHLSPSRFLHLFTAHSGTSFRRYRLWARMLRVGAALAAGQDLTRAATDAGFASPSHFSDTFHALFGLVEQPVPPTPAGIFADAPLGGVVRPWPVRRGAVRPSAVRAVRHAPAGTGETTAEARATGSRLAYTWSDGRRPVHRLPYHGIVAVDIGQVETAGFPGEPDRDHRDDRGGRQIAGDRHRGIEDVE